MAVRLRLKRLGKKRNPVYRVVAMEDSNPRDGAVLENLGQYDPLQDPVFLSVNEERAKHWLSCGAQPTDTVARLFASLKLVKPKVKKSSNQKVKKKDRQEKEAESKS